VASWRTQIRLHVGEASCNLSRSRWEVSMTWLNRSHPPCSCCWDGAQSPPWWCDPCIWVWWRGWWCCVAGCGAPSYIPEDGTLHNHHCENLKSYIEERLLQLC
jgi:hypothetical protein